MKTKTIITSVLLAIAASAAAQTAGSAADSRQDDNRQKQVKVGEKLIKQESDRTGEPSLQAAEKQQPAPLFELTAEMPEGTLGMCCGREAVVMNLGFPYYKVAVATCNVGAASPEDYGFYYTFDEILNGEVGLRDGWHAPTGAQLRILGKKLEYVKSSNALEHTFENGACLRLPLAGEDADGGERAYYWSNTKYAKIEKDIYGKSEYHDPKYVIIVKAWCLRYKKNVLCMVANNTTDKYTVRPFHELSMGSLTADSKEGDTGWFDSREAIVVDLPGIGLKAVALMNEGATSIDESETFEYQENKEYTCYGGFNDYTQVYFGADTHWRYPSFDELAALYSKMEWKEQDPEMQLAAGMRGKGILKSLFLPAAGKNSYLVRSFMGERGYYWFKDTDGEDDVFRFDSKGFKDTSIDREDHFYRFFHDLPE